MTIQPSGVRGSWSGDPDNWKMHDHDALPEPAPANIYTDQPTYDASAPGNLPPERFVKYVKGVLGARSADAPSVEVEKLRRVVLVMAAHIAHLEVELQNMEVKK